MSKEKIEDQIMEYLNERYPEDEFEIIRIESSTAPGDNIRSYTSKVSSKNYPRTDFFMNLKVVENLIFDVEDNYSGLLLDNIYLNLLESKFQNNDSIFYDVILGDFNAERPYLANEKEAKEYLRKNSQILWVDLIGLYIDDYEDTQAIEDIVTTIAYDLKEIYLGSHKIVVHFYPKELQKENLQFNSKSDVSRKAPQRKKLIADWTIRWKANDLEETNGKLEPFIENRKEIKQWRNKAN